MRMSCGTSARMMTHQLQKGTRTRCAVGRYPSPWPGPAADTTAGAGEADKRVQKTAAEKRLKPRRNKFNPKRCLLGEDQVAAKQVELAKLGKTVQYGGNPEHK